MCLVFAQRDQVILSIVVVLSWLFSFAQNLHAIFFCILTKFLIKKFLNTEIKEPMVLKKEPDKELTI